VLSGRGFDIVRRGWLVAVAVVAGVLGLPSSASALTAFTWSGAGSAPNWSAGTNWVGGTAPSGSVGTLTFPPLAAPCTTTCYQSSNDLTGLSADGISIDDSAPYQITGTGLTLGAGGIAATPSGAGSTANITLPITLGAPQNWSITGGASSELAVNTVTGSANTLAVNFSSSGILALNDVEAGAVTLTGSGVAAVFRSLNGTDGNPVSIGSPAHVAAQFAGATIGPITSTGGNIQVGRGHAPDGTLAVNGAIALNSTSVLTMFVDQPGTTPGTDYSQLTASGSVNLSGASLSLHGPPTGCTALHVGDVDTLVTTTGTLSGTFHGVAGGTTIPLICSGGTGTVPTVQINYTSNSVTATVMSTAPGGTTTALSPSASTALTNQTVTLTATVGPNSPVPAGGTVAFYDNGIAISGCTAQPVALNGSTYTATCQTSFAAVSSPHSLTAIFTPASGSGLQSSTGGIAQIVVNKDSTTTALDVSSATPAVGAQVTYIAIVTPADSGPAQPSGSVTFLDNGTPIPDCAGQGTLVSGLASCTLSYSAAGSHSISAFYSGDGSFAGSTSATQTVTAAPPPPTSITPPTISGSATQGQTLSETHGSWTNSPTSFFYQWQDCDSAGNSCTSIPGATSATYTLAASDVGHTVRVQEAAANAGGMSGAASSAVTAVVQPPSAAPTAPVSTSPPVITGTTVVGRTLSTSNGLWSGTPPSGYAYQWQRCSSSTGCANIAGANGTIYDLTGSDLGMKVRVVIVAVNNVGAGIAASKQVGPVLGIAQIDAVLAHEITPKGKLAKIGAILRAGGYELSFQSLESGRVVIGWYLVPPGAHLAKAAPVLVASGKATFTSAGKKQIKIKLTTAGKNLLRHASQLKLTAKETFTAPGQPQIVQRKTFTLKR
jgi:hypothetical protein